MCRCISLFDLTKNFCFSEHHRIESADDPAEVAGGVGFLLSVEVGSHAGVHLDFFREPDFDPFEGGPCTVRSEVEFGAVAGGDDHGFGGLGQCHQLVGSLAEFGVADGEALPHVHGGGAVIEAEAEKFHQTKAKTTRDRTNKTTAASESRRPVNPRTFLTASRTM